MRIFIHAVFFFAISMIISCTGNSLNSMHVQKENNEFIISYGSNWTDAAMRGIETSDSGFIVTGLSTSYPISKQACWVLKLDKYGAPLWSKSYGVDSVQTGYSIIEAKNGDYLICGYTSVDPSLNTEMLLFRVDQKGNVIWSKVFGGNDFDYITDLLELEDGSIIITGYTYSYGQGKDDVFLAKFNAAGDSLWTKIYGGKYNEHSYGVLKTSDSSFVITGFTKSFNNDFYKPIVNPENPDPESFFYDVYIIKTDLNGDTIWTKTVGAQNHDRAQFVQETKTGDYIFVGHTMSYSEYSDILAFKMNKDGELIWSKVLSSPFLDACYHVTVTNEDSYLIAGETHLEQQGEKIRAGILINLSTQGELIWSKLLYTEGKNTVLYNSIESKSGEVLAFGQSIVENGKSFDLIALKMNVENDSMDLLPDANMSISDATLDKHYTTTVISSGFDFHQHKMREKAYEVMYSNLRKVENKNASQPDRMYTK